VATPEAHGFASSSRAGVLDVMTKSTYVVFEVAGRSCALAREHVRRILLLPMLGRPPGLPSAVEGIIDVAGMAVPVIRLDRLFDLPQKPLHAYQHLILLAGAPPALALLADRATGVVSVADGAAVPLPEAETFNGCVTAQLSSERGPIFVLSVDRLLTHRERDALADFQAMERRRLNELRGAA